MTPDFAIQATSASDVFVSYASADAAIAKSIVENLEKSGVKCWMAPRDVTPGSQYADEIVGAINNAKVVVLVLSEHAVASTHVGKELERASSKRRRIIALRTDAAPLTRSFEYFLGESQWIDVMALGMPGALVKLTQAVGQGLAPSSWVSPGLGDDASNPADGKRGPTYLTIKRLVTGAVIVVVAAIVVSVVVRYWPPKQGAVQVPAVAAISDKSIAVLPFVDMSETKDQEYFADGMAEEILDLLTEIPGLTVIGRTSSFQFKGKNEDLRTIGAKLNAAYLLEGSVRKAGDQVRITAQLINTRTGAHEWSETYGRSIGDVLKLQDAIAAAVARELQLTIAPRDLSARTTVKNAEAYDLYLRGRHAADRWDQEGLDKAVMLFKKALERDPTSVDATAELAFAYYQQGADGFIAPASAFEQARHAATTALTLDPKSPRAHYVLGKIHMVYDWDWAAAEREFHQVEMLAPGSADATSGTAMLSLVLGRGDDALRQANAAIARDALDPNNFWILGAAQILRGHLREAEAAFQRMLDIRATYGYGHLYLGLVMLARGERDDALNEVQKETVDFAQQTGLAMVYFALGRRAESDAALSRMLKEQADGNAVGIADVYAFRGQSDEALQWLERAYFQKDAGLSLIKVELQANSLASEPRYKAFLRKMNLPE